MTITEVQKITGLTPRTIRWYNEMGLINPTYRGTTKRIAEYSDEDLALLNLIIILTESGLELKKIKELINTRTIFTLETLDNAINELQKRKSEIDGMIKYINVLKMYGENEFIEPYIIGLPMKALHNGESMIENIKKAKDFTMHANEEQVDLTDPATEPFIMFFLAIAFLSLRHLIDKPESETTQKLLTRLYNYVMKNKKIFEEEYESENEFAETLPQLLVEDDPDINFSKTISESWGPEALAFLKKAISIYCIRTKPD